MKITGITTFAFISSHLFVFSQSSSRNDVSYSFPKEKTILPLSYRSGTSPVVEVTLNGKGPFKFVFDTGASGEIARLDIAVLNELKLTTVDSILAGDGSGQNSRAYPVVALESISLGDFTINNPRAMVRDYNRRQGVDKIHGIIGLGFFKNVIVELNFENNNFCIKKEKLKGKNGSIPFNYDRGVPVFSAQLGSEKIDIVFDTGNMGGLTFHSKDIKPETIQGEMRVIGRAQTISNTFEIKEADLNISLKVGTLTFENPTVSINDMLPLANMGIKFSKQLNTIFDVDSRLMKFEKGKITLAGPSAVTQSSNKLNEYTGEYERGRTISLHEDGFIYIQRPGGMPIKMIVKNIDTFGLEAVPLASFKFNRDEKGKIISLNVSADGGANWETSKKK